MPKTKVVSWREIKSVQELDRQVFKQFGMTLRDLSLLETTLRVHRDGLLRDEAEMLARLAEKYPRIHKDIPYYDQFIEEFKAAWDAKNKK